MEQMRTARVAEVLGVSVSTMRRALEAALDVAGHDALEVHGELRGRGFVARRRNARPGEPWLFAIETPHQVAHETAADVEPTGDQLRLAEAKLTIASLAADLEDLREQLRQAEQQATGERDARLRLEGQVQALTEQWAEFRALLRADAPRGQAVPGPGAGGEAR